MDSSISTSMSDLILIMSAVEECVDCCSKSAAASAEVILAEFFVVFVKFLLMSSSVLSVDCCCVLVVNVLFVLLYERIVCWKIELLFCWMRLTVYICSCSESFFVLADWRMSNTERFLEMLLLLVCSLKDAGRQPDAPRVPYLPKPTTTVYLLPKFYLFFPNKSLSEYQMFCNKFYLWCLVLPKLFSVICLLKYCYPVGSTLCCFAIC